MKRTRVSKSTIYYVAGFLEGEGCFTTFQKWNKAKTIRLIYPKIVFATTDFDIAERIANLFNVSPVSLKTRKTHYKPIWQVSKAGKEAGKWMKLIYPIMSQRRKARIKQIIGNDI